MSINNNFAYHVQDRKKLTGLVSSSSQSMHYADSRKLGVKTGEPNVNYRPHFKTARLL